MAELIPEANLLTMADFAVMCCFSVPGVSLFSVNKATLVQGHAFGIGGLHTLYQLHFSLEREDDMLPNCAGDAALQSN